MINYGTTMKWLDSHRKVSPGYGTVHSNAKLPRGTIPGRKVGIVVISAISCFMIAAVSNSVLAQDSPKEMQPPFEYMITKIKVSNLEKSLEFYSSFFGYKEVLRTPVSAAGMVQVYTTKGGQNYQHGLTLVHEKEKNAPIPKGALHTIVFSVMDLLNLVDRIESAGYEITMAPRETKNYTSSVSSSAVIAYALDPDGYPVEMVEWKP